MSKGKAKVNYLGRSGVVMPQTVPSWDFLYEVSSIRNPKYNIGDKVVLPDGRVFFYCKSSGQCDTFIANQFDVEIPGTGGIDYSVLAAGAAKGAKSVVMTNQGTLAQTLDGLRGGRINIGTDNNLVQQRGIIGNTAGGVSDEITIYLDAALTRAVTVADYAYCMPSQYSRIIGAQQGDGDGSNKQKSFVGYAAASVTAANMYHWEQTWGPICASLYGAAVGKTDLFREVVFRYDGNLMQRGATTLGLESQTAGFIMDANTQANGATVIMLKVAR